MRTMMKVSIPVEAGNRAIKEGMLAKTVMSFVDAMKPETAFFAAEGGKRTAYFVFDLPDPTMIPSVAEPFFTNLGASIDMSPVMNLAEMKTGVEKAMKRG